MKRQRRRAGKSHLLRRAARTDNRHMTETDIAKVISQLRNQQPSRGADRLLSPCVETRFPCWRETKDHGTQEVVVIIRDYGEGYPSDRFSAAAAIKNGKELLFAPGKSIEAAVAAIQWHRLDEPPAPRVIAPVVKFVTPDNERQVPKEGDKRRKPRKR